LQGVIRAPEPFSDGALKMAIELLQKGQQQLQQDSDSDGRASAAATPPPLEYSPSQLPHFCCHDFFVRFRASAEFVIAVQHEKDVACAGNPLKDFYPSDANDDDAEVLQRLQELNERKRESLQLSAVVADDVGVHADGERNDDAEYIEPPIFEMQQRTQGIFRRCAATLCPAPSPI
jgi:hypothetical protein